MSIEIGILIAIIGCVISVATFYIGRQSHAKTKGQEWGEVRTNINFIKEDLGEIKTDIGSNEKALRSEILKEREERRSAVSRLHVRLDEHVKNSHGGKE